MPALVLIICFLAGSCFGQAFTLRNQPTIIATIPVAAAGPALVNFHMVEDIQNTSVSSTFTVTAGNTLVVGVAWVNADDTITVDDTRGNTFTGLTKEYSSTLLKGSQIFYAKNITGGSDTITAHTPAGGSVLNFPAIGIWQFSGLSASAPLDKQSITNSDAAPVTVAVCPSVTTTSANEALVCVITVFGNTVTPQTGWTEDGEGANLGEEFQHRIVSSTGTYHGEGTLGGSDNFTMAFGTFK